MKPIADQALAIVHEIAASYPVDWNMGESGDDCLHFGWNCAFCKAFAMRDCTRFQAARMRDDEHHSQCLWIRARALLGAADPQAKQDAP